MKPHPFISRTAFNKRCSAFTLVEMLTSIGVASLVLAALVSFSLFIGRSFVALGNYDDLDRTSRNTLDVMSKDIRQARTMTSFTNNQLVFATPAGGTFSYTYNTGQHTLIRTWTDGTQTVLLTNCDYLAFGISQRNPSNNFTFYPADCATNAKLVNLTWACSRSILGSKANTESIQTARIVIRN